MICSHFFPGGQETSSDGILAGPIGPAGHLNYRKGVFTLENIFKINYIALIIVTLLIVADIVTGLIKCYVGKSEKTDDGKFKSSIMRQCGIKKIAVVIFVVCINILTNYFNIDYIGNICYIYYIATEGLSVCENLNSIGIPVPWLISNLLKQKKKEGEEDDSTNNIK